MTKQLIMMMFAFACIGVSAQENDATEAQIDQTVAVGATVESDADKDGSGSEE